MRELLLAAFAFQTRKTPHHLIRYVMISHPVAAHADYQNPPSFTLEGQAGPLLEILSLSLRC